MGERQVRPGQLVSPGTQVLSFIARDGWVQANFRETQLTNIKVGDPVDIRVDVYPGERMRGRVLEIAPASGSQFALLPPDNATGNFTKVVQRVPVKIALDDSSADDAVAIGTVGGRHDPNEVVREPIERTMSNASAVASDSIAKPDRIAALRSVLPADLSHSPLLGILGVIMGAGIASLAARLLSLGLADLRGHLGVGVDDGAWIATAFNTATVFIGPFTVYLGALLGARRVLLVGCVVFATVSACLPFVHSYSLLIVLLAIAGLSSGTFYPLTISFALLNVPLRYLALTLGVYATCIEGALNFAPSLYGFYRDHWSWTWMFWTSALVTPIMAACVYYGIPASRAAGAIGTETELRRLPVFQRRHRAAVCRDRPGTTARLVAVGRVHGTLRVRNVSAGCAPSPAGCARPTLSSICHTCANGTRIALALALFAFRFVLLATALVIPQSLVPRSRCRAVRSCRAVDGGGGNGAGRLRGAPAEQRNRLAAA